VLVLLSSGDAGDTVERSPEKPIGAKPLLTCTQPPVDSMKAAIDTLNE
jgi:hypothetical protein